MEEEILSRSVSSKKKKKSQKSNRQPSKLLLVCSFAIAVAIFGSVILGRYVLFASPKTPPEGPVSRQVMTLAQTQIKAARPAPTLAALYYAYITSVYYDALGGSDQSNALAATGHMMVLIFPDKSSTIASGISTIAKRNNLKALPESSPLSPAAQRVLTQYQQRFASDNHTLAWDGVIPTGQGKWVQTTPIAPFTPHAGEWKRWVVTQPISVPAPPVYGSAEDLQQLAIVQQAVAKRNGEDINIINKWAGQPGSETPAGIWQNVMFDKLQPDLSTDAVRADRQNAYIQKVLAQSMSDAFMECWKVKYMYWTARPDMRIPGLQTAMHDPNFPSYISGHSTISKAAADVLSVLVPKYATVWEADALEARNSRLMAGIHFEIDNSVGFDVGTNVGQQFVTNLGLKPEL